MFKTFVSLLSGQASYIQEYQQYIHNYRVQAHQILQRNDR